MKIKAGMANRLTIEKRNLRHKSELVRQSLHKTNGHTAPQLVLEKFKDWWVPPPGTVISAFWPFRSELDLRPLLRYLYDRSYIVALPEVVGKGEALLFREWRPDAKLEKDKFGVLSLPKVACIVEPDWLLVPLLAFDLNGYRLGYGGGFYDATLAKLREIKKVYTIGAAYQGQLVDSVPHTKHDERLDAVLTEGCVFIT